MTLRIRSIDDLPEVARARARAQFEAARPQVVPASAKALRLARLSEERERLVLALLEQLKYVRLDVLFEREYRFHVERKWRLDLFARSQNLGIEVHGGLSDRVRGRHVRQKGFEGDREKVNAAIEYRIRVLEYWPRAIASGEACAQIERVIARGG